MHPRLRRAATILLAGTLALSGCGEPKRVTYVDPNASLRSGGGATGAATPIARYGAATAERSRAIIRIRATLAAARTLAGSDPAAARAAVARAIREDLPFIEPRLARANPVRARALRTGLSRLADRPPPDEVAYANEVRRISNMLLGQAADLVVGAEARNDPAYQAVLLHDTLQLAATSYEAAFGEDQAAVTEPADYLLAYGLVIDARTRQASAIPQPRRARLASSLDRVARSSMPGPSPPPRPRSPQQVVGELATIADDIVRAAQVDPTSPKPAAETPDRLRALKRSMASVVEAWERGDRAPARAELRQAGGDELRDAADGVATVAPSLLVELERRILLEIPRTMESEADITQLASEVDGFLDEAIQLVEDELELLREEG